jgi:uncharacterized protein YgbK (DUF1537 family)
MIGVIADDLTGAAELGGVGLRHGLHADILLSGPILDGADLVCLDTDSRSSPPPTAERQAASAARQLRAARARWIYKKVDSVLRGNVVAEVAAIMNELGLPRALLLPANPSLGRVIREGRYYVNGRPIHETDFARDPEYPRTSSEVRELLLGASKQVPVCVRRVGDSLPALGIVLGEVGTPDDVRQWATCRATDMLTAGGAEFFGALLDVAGFETPASSGGEAPRPAPKLELFVCGSTSDYTRRFVREARARRTPVFSLPDAAARGGQLIPASLEAIAQTAASALESNPRVILQVGLPLVEDRAAARMLAVHLVKVAALVLARAKVGDVYVDGGATAAELTRRMGWTCLKVLRELAPGVTTLGVKDSPALRLTIKPGSYAGWPV